MKNRIPDYLSDSRRTDQPSEPAFQELRELVRKQFAHRMRWIKKVFERNRTTRSDRTDNSWRTVRWVIPNGVGSLFPVGGKSISAG